MLLACSFWKAAASKALLETQLRGILADRRLDELEKADVVGYGRMLQAFQAKRLDLGLQLRRAFFRDFLPSNAYAADLFSTGYPALVRMLYRTAFPATRVVMKLDMQITDHRADEGLRRTQEALDIVIKNRGPEGYLIGDRFSVADLAAAVILQPVALPDEYPVAFPRPHPPGVEKWLARWAAHPGTDWVREMYRRHRGHSVATEDRNG